MPRVSPVLAAKAATPPREVTPQRTPTAPAAVRAALATAYRKQHGVEPSAGLLDVLTAQVSLETGRGDRMFNYNFGGIKGAGPSGATARYRTAEITEEGTEKHITDGFRAYGSLGEGAKDYLATLTTRYPAALSAAARGDVDGFAVALKQRGYFTAHLEDYSTALRGLLREGGAPARRAVGPATEVSPPTPFTLPTTPSDGMAFATTEVVSRVLDAVAAMTAVVSAPIDDERRKG